MALLSVDEETWTGGESPISLDHEYDNADNLKKLRGVNWTMDLGSDQVTASALAGYTAPAYNPSGEITSAGGFQFLNTAHGKLGHATGESLDGGVFAGAPTDLRFNYDSAGLRTYQLQSFGGLAARANHEETYLYDGASLVCRWAGVWATSQNYTNAVSDLGNIASPDAFVLYLWGPTGVVMEFDTSGNSKAFLHDPLGNVLNTTTEDGRAQKPLFYDGYGLPVWPDEEESQRVRRQPLQYKGQFGYYTDVHTGLSYCHNRYYDPRMGRWLSRDPIGLAGGTNVYSYCAGDPVNLVDPDGLQVRDWIQKNLTEPTLATMSRARAHNRKHAPAFAWAGDLTMATGDILLWPGRIANFGSSLRKPTASNVLDDIAVLTAGIGAVGSMRSVAAPTVATVTANRARGLATQTMVPGATNTTRIASLTGTAKFRIPDIFGFGVIGDVKDVAYLSYNSQLRDLIAYAQKEKMYFELYVRPGAKLSAPLRKALGNATAQTKHGLDYYRVRF